MNLRNIRSLTVLCAIMVIGTCGCCTRSKPKATPSLTPDSKVETVLASKLFPLKRKKGKFKITEGAQAGKTFDYRLEPDGLARWKLILTGVRVVYYQVNEDGSIAIRGEDEFADDVAVRYDPPLTVLPNRLITGKIYESQGAMKVTGLTSGAARDKGSCKVVVSFIGREKVRVGEKTINAYRVINTRQIKLGLANANIDAITDYAEDRGPVQDQMKQVTRILGIFPTRKTEALLMLD